MGRPSKTYSVNKDALKRIMILYENLEKELKVFDIPDFRLLDAVSQFKVSMRLFRSFKNSHCMETEDFLDVYGDGRDEDDE